MEDLDMLYTTKLYLQKLAVGLNPFDSTELPEDSLYQNVVLCRAFMYAADMLEKIIKNDGMIVRGARLRKDPFRISRVERDSIVVTDEPVGVSVISTRIAHALPQNVRTLASANITAWLESEGLLETVMDGNQKVRIATQDGNKIGIQTETLVNQRDGREYRKNLYGKDAQKYVIENLDNIAAFGKGRRDGMQAEKAG